MKHDVFLNIFTMGKKTEKMKTKTVIQVDLGIKQIIMKEWSEPRSQGKQLTIFTANDKNQTFRQKLGF